MTISPPVVNSLKRLRVLYVEDDAETREELELILSSWVCKLYTAANGEEGLQLYEQHQPDIIITDIQMPVMNGLDMATTIKARDPDQWIIILSAYNDTEFLFSAMEMGLQDYVTKPVNVEHLLERLFRIAEQIDLRNQLNRQQTLLEQYKLLVDEKAVVAKVDRSGKICFVNEKFCLLFGYSQDEINGNYYLSCFLPGQDKVVADLQQKVAECGKWQGLVKKRNKAGEIYVVDLTVMAIRDSDGQVEEYVALMVDMTDVHETIERLSLDLQQDATACQHYTKEYERALELGTSLCVLTLDGKIVSANENFSKSLACKPEDLVGLSFSDIESSGCNFQQRILNKVRADGYATRLVTIKDRSGADHTFSTVIVAIHDQAGGIQSLLGLHQDISDSIRLNQEIIETQKELICILGEVVEGRSRETGMHIKRVAKISKLLAVKLGLSEEYAEMIRVTAPMHDIGKVGIPDDILHKPGKLTEAEYEVMKQHAYLGFDMLKGLDRPLVKMAAQIAHQHHERFDGTGYPLGLKGDDISIEGRIVSLVDVFDALGARRSYKTPWSDEEIIKYIKSQSGKHFDPELVDLFLHNYAEISAIRDKFKDDLDDHKH
jgi:PAS domain S-box-containing protein